MTSPYFCARGLNSRSITKHFKDLYKIIQSPRYYTTCPETDDRITNEELQISCYHGWPSITIPLPSREMNCKFILRPISHTIQDFYQNIQHEDNGIDKIFCSPLNINTPIDSSLPLHHLLSDDFKLTMNEEEYIVRCQKTSNLSDQDIESLIHITASISKMFESLHVHEFDVIKEKALISEREDLLMQLLPLEVQKRELDKKAAKEVRRISWIGLFFMSFQTGIFARLTWWEFSWDIMEPVTYFTGYVTLIACASYFILTKERYVVDKVADRFHLKFFYKRAKDRQFDYDKYNYLKDEVARIDDDLKRLRNPTTYRTINSIILKSKNELAKAETLIARFRALSN